MTSKTSLCFEILLVFVRVYTASTSRQEEIGFFTIEERFRQDVLEDSSKALGPYGGSSGDWFSDFGPSLYGPISSILIRHGGIIDGIQFIYGDNTEGTFAGGLGGNAETLVLNTDEYIHKIRIGMDQGSEYVGQLYFTTNKHTYGPYGMQNTTLWDVEHGGQPLMYVSGRYSSYLNALTFHWKDL
ncbi:zymogen granule membrane protein 16-like [Lingula anatina]|uniref:Zymogen granule membrane protein 16-like n=1 Tax=Lingula anatina TaxID=7574 RepID=A0A1S3KAS4_LINAN|nr:zymogen granule membrane protein 16-like [Lingula anatina]|eukprot:XP_013419743.1 zymogen granule membrane protein 16-like [Lingula anatina]